MDFPAHVWEAERMYAKCVLQKPQENTVTESTFPELLIYSQLGQHGVANYSLRLCRSAITTLDGNPKCLNEMME